MGYDSYEEGYTIVKVDCGDYIQVEKHWNDGTVEIMEVINK